MPTPCVIAVPVSRKTQDLHLDLSLSPQKGFRKQETMNDFWFIYLIKLVPKSSKIAMTVR